MNYTKANKICFNAICSGNKCFRFNIDDKTILVTPDGYRGFIFPDTAINFNLSKVQTMKTLPVTEIISDENRLVLTADLRLDTGFRRNLMYRRLKGEGKNVFVNIKYLECFNNPKFYQLQDRLSAIVVTEDVSATKKDVPVGYILPIRSNLDEGYYSDMQEKGGVSFG